MKIPSSEYELTAIRASGPGGQHVNKVATAIQLRFDIRSSSLDEATKERLLSYPDKRITQDGIILIKAGKHRSQLKNREEAVARLHKLIRKATHKKKKRKPTKPSKSAVEKRLKDKSRRGEVKKCEKK